MMNYYPFLLSILIILMGHRHEGNCEPIRRTHRSSSSSSSDLFNIDQRYGRRIARSFNGTTSLHKSGQNVKAIKTAPSETDDADSDDMTLIFKALGLPEDFAEIKRSTKIDTSDVSPASSSPSPFPVTPDDEDKLLYMTGSERLDKIMRCPCNRHQLTSLGLHGYRSDYRNPPLIPYDEAESSSNSLLHHHHHHRHQTSSSVLDVEHRGSHSLVDGASKGKLFGQLIRLILDLPKLKLAILKPLILGLVDTTAQVTQKAAELQANMAHRVPEILYFKAELLKKIIDSLGDAAGPILAEVSDHLHKAAWAKRSFAEKLPHHLSVVAHKTEDVTSTIGKVAHGLSGTSEKIASEVIKVAKTKGKLVKSVLDESHAFKSGLLEGLKGRKQQEQQQHHHQVHHVNEWSPALLYGHDFFRREEYKSLS